MRDPVQEATVKSLKTLAVLNYRPGQGIVSTGLYPAAVGGAVGRRGRRTLNHGGPGAGEMGFAALGRAPQLSGPWFYPRRVKQGVINIEPGMFALARTSPSSFFF